MASALHKQSREVNNTRTAFSFINSRGEASAFPLRLCRLVGWLVGFLLFVSPKEWRFHFSLLLSSSSS
ncbi:hypothetical protein SLEP1_g1357 [Rubroshorea leprosula]|uniref:Uncharacterized protein n=1 Tax=Rubroshorea leprosula TaxID=152421 RepID=A0AAV5HJF1_9ROSI|nr:hypothetical protein SLEP1_g1357 [Rubroshorea leprosula]